MPEGTESEELIRRGQREAAVWMWRHSVQTQRGRVLSVQDSGEGGCPVVSSWKAEGVGVRDSRHIVHFGLYAL